MKLAVVTRRLVAVMAVVAATALVTNVVVSSANSQPDHDHDHKHGDKNDKHGGGEMDMAKMMAAYQKLGAPGPNHDALKMFAGKWDAVSTWYMQEMPGMPKVAPSVSKAESKAEIVLGGRYIHHHYKGHINFPGPNGMEKKPFEGFGVMGYDNAAKEYVSMWIDDISTMLFTERGQYDAAKKTFTMRSSYPDPMTGKTTAGKSTLQFTGKDKYTLTMYKETAPDKWFKELEIVYTRGD